MTATLERPSATGRDSASTASGHGGGARRIGPTLKPASPLLAEVGLLAVSLATAVGFCRVFLGWDFLAPLGVAAVGSHLLGAVARRRRWNLLLTSVASLLAVAVVVAVGRYRDTTTFLLPTSATWDLARDELSQAWSAFPTAVAPVPTEGGFLAAAMIALWAVGYFADLIAFRLRLAFEAILPAGVVFVFCSAIGADRNRVTVTVLWALAAVAAVAALRALRDTGRPGWLAGGRRRSVAGAVRTALVLGVLAAAIGFVLGPALPGAGERAVIQTKNSSGGRRVTDNPFVTLRSRLSTPTTDELFRVRSDHKSYWRLTALDTFDGTSWTLSAKVRGSDGRMGGGDLPSDLTQTSTQVVTIGALDSSWVPTAYEPVQLTGLTGTRYNPETGAVLVDRGQLKQGTTYTVVSQVPANISPDVLRQRLTVPTGLDPQWTQLPGSFPSSLRALAKQITATATTPYDEALALQQFFRDNFTYDLQVGAGSSNDAMLTFLENRRGYCEQFAGAFAAFARSLGLPARVAVGYTPGVQEPDGTWSVEGKHAHAWPEVYFQGIGWLPFEPTPSRGNPDAESYTYVQGQQVDEAPVDAPTTTVAEGAPTSLPNSLPTFAFDPSELLPGGTLSGVGPTSGARSHGSFPWVPVGVGAGVVAVLAAWLGGVPALRRRRWEERKRAAATVNERVLVTWDQAREALDSAGVRVRASDSPLEAAARLRRTPRVDATALAALAERASAAAYTAGELPASALDDAEAARRRLEAGLEKGTSRLLRLRRRADVRALLRPLPR